MTEQIFKDDAKQLIDMFFDNKLFIKTLTRDDMNEIENFLSFIMQSKFESHIKAKTLLDKIRGKEANR